MVQVHVEGNDDSLQVGQIEAATMFLPIPVPVPVIRREGMGESMRGFLGEMRARGESSEVRRQSVKSDPFAGC